MHKPHVKVGQVIRRNYKDNSSFLILAHLDGYMRLVNLTYGNIWSCKLYLPGKTYVTKEQLLELLGNKIRNDNFYLVADINSALGSVTNPGTLNIVTYPPINLLTEDTSDFYSVKTTITENAKAEEYYPADPRLLL